MGEDWGDDDDDFLCSVDWDAQEERLRSHLLACVPTTDGAGDPVDCVENRQVNHQAASRDCLKYFSNLGKDAHGCGKKRQKVHGGVTVTATLVPPSSSSNSNSGGQGNRGKSDVMFVISGASGGAKNDVQNLFKGIEGCVWDDNRSIWTCEFSRCEGVARTLSSVSQGLVDTFHPLHIVPKSVLKHVNSVRDDSMRYSYIPASLEEKLMPFQREGVQFILKHGGRALLGDEMGLGKTVQALAILCAYREEWPVLIVCPSSLRESWSNAIQEWLGVPEEKIRVIHSGKDAEGTKVGKFQFLVVSFNFLDKMELAKKFSIVVVDESHYLKDPSAKRTKAAMPILKESKRCVLLTGTPALNRPKEIFTQLSAVVPKAQLKLKDFGERYCTGNRFDKYGGAKNLEELHALLRNSVMIRRLKVDVLAELPKKRRQQIYLSLDAASRKKLDALKQQLQEAKSAIHQLVAQSIASNRGNVVNVGAEQRSVVMEVYKKTADIKVKCVQDYIDTLLDGDQKFLVFAHHTVLLDAVEHSCNRKKNCKYIRIDGSTPASSRAGLVQSFQTDDSVRVAILSIKAAGVGLTMTAASTVVFAEMTWTPGEIIQAEDRAHRIGQASSVNVYFLHIKDSIDDVIWNTIQSKLENLGQTLDGADQNLHLSQTSRVMPERGQSSLDKYLTQSQPSLQNTITK